MCVGGVVTLVVAGYFADAFIGTVSVFWLMLMAHSFFGGGSYTIIAPYMAEVWPAGLRASGMGLGYGVGNFGKIISPLGLALIVGGTHVITPEAAVDAMIPAMFFLAFWGGPGGGSVCGARDGNKGPLDRGDRRRARRAGANQGGGPVKSRPRHTCSGAVRRLPRAGLDQTLKVHSAPARVEQAGARQWRVWVVCHERTVWVGRCGTVREMKEGPSRPAVRCRSQATASCCRQERSLCHPLGAPQVQAVASQDQGGTRLV